ncbi:hypothetical protein BOX15_Mlig015560g2 [Macrostomum lignano]|uniref:CHCH domain-containing protein n=1 Tax=Macrostomum lignano TaxID=282301 RepID=A0A267G8J0_9PLAT|nr:hypothetical protein BOX15_Mlig015560g2 [Macrostomum lignano]
MSTQQQQQQESKHSWKPTPSNDEEEDVFEAMLKRTGCLDQHNDVMECMAEHRDWRQCQEQVRKMKVCMAKYQETKGGQST